MEDNLGGLSHVNLFSVVGAGAAVLFLGVCVISRQLTHVLWSIVLAGVAVSLLLFPQHMVTIFAAAAAVASLVVLVSGIQARRAQAALQVELSRLTEAVAALQGRLILRLSTPHPPLSASRATEAQISLPPEPHVVAEQAEALPASPTEVV